MFTDQEQNDGDAGSTQTKKQIIKAASKLFEKKGLYQTSVGEIAERAGVSVPEAYKYVRRKSEIMLLIMEDFTNQFQKRIQPEIEFLDDPKEKLFRAMKMFYAIVAENAPQTLLLYRESNTLDKQGQAKIMDAELAYVHIFRDILEEGVRLGVFKPHDTEQIAYNIVLLGHSWVLKRWHFKKRFELEGYVDYQYNFFINAISL
ncbi:MAG: TetR family transcriptional regulator [Deltaproteobacteria bacterium]|nr:TetR family transcriptional regulator [Deltaproteobacteria bacterium]MBW2053124.1 TetR family transcriptional regulator [Deltaproteobacteria bacterium]MBW2141897.1 TetR family transcriptional regulator [Deltaproteobacteria bacterium]MBW2323500.1 TetR family transcriptional regulator [Deltaproteobacteria bacterium]